MHSGRRTASRPRRTPEPAAGTVHPPGGFWCQPCTWTAPPPSPHTRGPRRSRPQPPAAVSGALLTGRKSSSTSNHLWDLKFSSGSLITGFAVNIPLQRLQTQRCRGRKTVRKNHRVVLLNWYRRVRGVWGHIPANATPCTHLGRAVAGRPVGPTHWALSWEEGRTCRPSTSGQTSATSRQQQGDQLPSASTPAGSDHEAASPPQHIS